MRRLLTWYLPLVSGTIISILFAWGFAKGLRGDAGEVVRDSPGIPDRGVSRTALDEEGGSTLIVVLGDSLARGTGDDIGEGIGGRLSSILDERGVDHALANLAVNGAKTGDLLTQMERVSVHRLLGDASIVLVSIGGNDFFGERGSFGITERPPEDPEVVIDPIQDRIERVVSEIREASPGSTIFLLGLYNPFAALPGGEELTPMVARWNASLLGRFSHDPRVVIVQTSDLFLGTDRLSADSFHPSGETYGLIARRIADAL